MLKQLTFFLLSTLVTLTAHAFDKNEISLNQQFEGRWTIYHAKSQCTEIYDFAKQGQFSYTAQQKQLKGEYGIFRNDHPNILDLLVLKVNSDNNQRGCSTQAIDFSDATIQLALKWFSPRSAELCTDRDGKTCLGIYLSKQN